MNNFGRDGARGLRGQDESSPVLSSHLSPCRLLQDCQELTDVERAIEIVINNFHCYAVKGHKECLTPNELKDLVGQRLPHLAKVRPPSAGRPVSKTGIGAPINPPPPPRRLVEILLEKYSWGFLNSVGQKFPRLGPPPERPRRAFSLGCKDLLFLK